MVSYIGSWDYLLLDFDRTYHNVCCFVPNTKSVVSSIGHPSYLFNKKIHNDHNISKNNLTPYSLIVIILWHWMDIK